MNHSVFGPWAATGETEARRVGYPRQTGHREQRGPKTVVEEAVSGRVPVNVSTGCWRPHLRNVINAVSSSEKKEIVPQMGESSWAISAWTSLTSPGPLLPARRSRTETFG